LIVLPENIKKILALGLILTIGLVFINTALNGHFHNVQGVGIVYHTHSSHTMPIDSKFPAGNSHSHSQSELAFFDMLSNPVFIASVILVVLAITLLREKRQRFARHTHVITAVPFLTPSLRAPPAFAL